MTSGFNIRVTRLRREIADKRFRIFSGYPRSTNISFTKSIARNLLEPEIIMSVYGCGGKSSAWTSELVIVSFEDAMRTLRALPCRGYSTRMSSLRIELPADHWPAEPEVAALKLPVPSGRAIDEMDRVFAWITFISSAQIALRKIVLLRAVTNGVEKPMSWAKIARAIGADKAAVPRWHAEAIALITRALNAGRVSPPCARDFA